MDRGETPDSFEQTVSELRSQKERAANYSADSIQRVVPANCPPNSQGQHRKPQASDGNQSQWTGGPTRESGEQTARKSKGADSFQPRDFSGRQLGSFQLIERLGTGGFGSVYSAIDLTAKSPQLARAAVKVLHHDAETGANPQIEKEIDALRSLSHPNVVAYLDSGIDEGVGYIAMQYVDGPTIIDYCAENDCDWREIVELVIQACSALEHAHSRGILHCDVKPQNILVDESGEAVITDFGLVKFVEARVTKVRGAKGRAAKPRSAKVPGSGGQVQKGHQCGAASEVTINSNVLGTPAYMAPEQFGRLSKNSRPRPLTIAADIFGLGATLYRLLSGSPPRTRESSLSALAAASHDSVSDLKFDQLEISGQLALVLAKSMDPEPERRYATAREFRDDLENVLNLRPVKARPPSRLNRAYYWMRREPHLAGLTALTLVSLVVACFGIAASWRASAEKQRDAESQSHQLVETLDQVRSLVAGLKPGERLNGQTRREVLTIIADGFGDAAQAYPENSEAAYKHAQANFVLGAYLHDIGEPQQAIDAIEQAKIGFLDLRKTPSIDIDTIHFDLFHCYTRLGHLLSQQDRKLSKIYLGNALRFIQEVYTVQPNNLDYAGAYAVGLIHAAQAMKDDHDQEWYRDMFIEAYRVSLEICKSPDANALQFRQRTNSLRGLAMLEFALGNIEESTELNLQGVQFANETIDLDPEEWGSRRDRILTLHQLAKCLHVLGQTAESHRALDEAMEDILWLREKRPDADDMIDQYERANIHYRGQLSQN